MQSHEDVLILIPMTAGVLILLVIGFAAAVGWIPGVIAFSRHHRNATAIMVCGLIGALFFGIFWFVALVWSLTDNCEPASPTVRPRYRHGGRVRRRRKQIRSRDVADNESADALAELMGDD